MMRIWAASQLFNQTQILVTSPPELVRLEQSQPMTSMVSSMEMAQVSISPPFHQKRKRMFQELIPKTSLAYLQQRFSPQ